MTYVPPSRREDPERQQLPSVVRPSTAQRCTPQQRVLPTAVPSAWRWVPALLPGHGNFQRAQHGDRRAGPHPGGAPATTTTTSSNSAPPAPVQPVRCPYVAPYHREEKVEDEIFKEHTPGINFDQYESIEMSVTPNDIAAAESFREMTMHPSSWRTWLDAAT